MNGIVYPQAVHIRMTTGEIRVFTMTKAPAVPEITLRDGEVLVKVEPKQKEKEKD